MSHKDNPYLKPLSKKQKENYAHYLSPGEKMLNFAGLSRLYLVRKILLRFVFPGAILIIAAILIMYFVYDIAVVFGLLTGYALSFIMAYIIVYFEAKGTQYILTDRRVIMQKGYFNVSLTSASYDKITHVEVNQNFIEMTIYKFGQIVIHTAGGSSTKDIIMDNIAHPMHFKNALEDLIDKAQHRRPVTKNKKRTPKWKNRDGRGLKKLL